MIDSDRLTILVGLLDFYSDRATAHASFVVATIFGMYTLLFGYNYEALPFPIFFLAYLALLVIAVYSFLNFGYYASLAFEIRHQLEGHHRDAIKKAMQKGLEKRHRLYNWFRWFRSGIDYKSAKYMLLLVLWISAIVIPFAMVSLSRLPKLIPSLQEPTSFVFWVMIGMICALLTIGCWQGRRKKKNAAS